MLPLKLGLLNYLLKADKEGNCKDIVFIPAALNYDRIPEFKTLISNKKHGFNDKGRFYSLLSFLRFLASVTTYVMPRRHKPFGYACVNFGKPVSLSRWQDENHKNIKNYAPKQRREAINQLGQYLAAEINTIIPILPTNILACVLNENKDHPLSVIELKTEANALIQKLTQEGISVFLPKNDEDYALSQGIYILIRERIIEPMGDGRFQLLEGSEQLLAYYRDTVPK